MRTLGLLVAIAVLAAPAAAQANDELIVRFKPGADASARRAARAAVDGKLKGSLALPRTQLVAVDGSVRAAARELAARDDVAYAHPNYVLHTMATPNDPKYGELWGLRAIAAPQAWDVTTGSDGVKVAVIDSGVDYDHPDLAGNIWHNPGETGDGREDNGVDDDGNGKIDDWRGWDFTDDDNDPHDGAATHGTHVAGTIGAQGNNGTGVAGVNWNVGLMPLRVGRDDGSIDLAAAVDAMVYAGRMGARVANMSFGGSPGAGQPAPQAELDALRASPDTLFVASAGNGGSDGVGDDNDATPSYPCNYSTEPNLICVAATDKNDELTGFSNYGPEHVQIAAPGESILSTQPIAQIHDDFETDVPGRWQSFEEPWGGFLDVPPSRWARTTETAHSGKYSYTDSPGDWADSLTNSGIELSTPVSTLYDPAADDGYDHCFIDFWWRPRPSSDFNYYPYQVLHIDTLDPTFQVDNAWFDTASLQLGAFDDAWRHENVVFIPGHLFKDRIMVRFRLSILYTTGADGVYVDDVKIWCGPPVPPEYDVKDGTSMASPHVTGAAALVLAKVPNLTPGALKQRLMNAADRLQALKGKVTTNGRLNVARALAGAGPDELPPDPPPATPTPTPTPTATATPTPPPAATVAELRLRPGRITAGRTGTISFTLGAPGTVAFTVERAASGRKIGAKCARATRRNARKRACQLWKAVRGGFKHTSVAGANKVAFAGAKSLKPGSYRLTARADGDPQTVTFTVKRKRRH